MADAITSVEELQKQNAAYAALIAAMKAKDTSATGHFDLVDAGLTTLIGGAASSFGYLGGQFVEGIATAIGYAPLANAHLPVIVAGTMFVGFAVFEIRKLWRYAKSLSRQG